MGTLPGHGDLAVFSRIIAEDSFISGSWVLVMVYCGLSEVSCCGQKDGRVDW